MIDPYEKLIKKIEKSDFICDLSEFISLDTESLNLILKEITKRAFISSIKWNENVKTCGTHSKDLIEKIEAQISLNNENYEYFPTDYIHCLLCTHCSLDEIQTNETNNQKNILIKEMDWYIYQKFQEKGYKSIIYVNDHRKQAILAFQGIKIDILDFFDRDSNVLESVIYSSLANKQIASQTYFAFLHTKIAIDLCKNEKYNYSLSFTGYSFGAWLAEQAVFFSHRDAEYYNVKAVTFDSPGSFDYLKRFESNIYSTKTKFDLATLDISTYLTAPNFINTCNVHIGKVYRIFTESKKNLNDLNEFILSSIGHFPIKMLKEQFMSFYNQRIKPKLLKYSFYLNGIKALFAEGLDLIFSQFDPNTHKPNKYKELLDWPKINFVPSKEFVNNFKNILSSENVCKILPKISLPILQPAIDIIYKSIALVTRAVIQKITDSSLGNIL